MLSLQSHHITDLYVFVDDSLKASNEQHHGRPAILSNSEMITILIWGTLIFKQKNLKEIHKLTKMYLMKEFPKLPKYNAFLDHYHREIPQLHYLLSNLLQTESPIVFVDSTMIEVCKLVRADHHKVAKKIAAFGKNHQGWHYGLKLHGAVNFKGQFSSLAFTPANMYDAQMLPFLVNDKTKVAVGDGGYTASVMRRFIWETTGTVIISPPHHKQKNKVICLWQHLLLQARPKIESVFDYLKEHLHFVTSFPRSCKGYLAHYLRVLLAYQLLVI